MQELQFVQDDSDPSSLILRAVEGEQEYFLPVTGELTEFLGIAAELSTEDEPSDDSDDAGSQDGADASSISNDSNTAPDAEPQLSAVASTVTQDEPAPRERIHLRPRDIQDRIRHGESVEQIVAATGMEDRQIRPFAAPIDMERHRITELARDAYPVRSDGPAEQPLREVLATAFGARGESLRASDWSAAMDSSDHWIISVTWEKGNRPGATQFVAEFRFIPAQGGPATAVPVNSVASDLIDPRFERPVRTVSPVVPASRQGDDAPVDGDDAGGVDGRDGWGSPEADDGLYDNAADAAAPDEADGADPNAPVDLFGNRGAQDAHDGADGNGSGDDGDNRSRRKKKAVTPHWEDVLLGVRTNPRANGRNKKK